MKDVKAEAAAAQAAAAAFQAEAREAKHAAVKATADAAARTKKATLVIPRASALSAQRFAVYRTHQTEPIAAFIPPACQMCVPRR